MTKDKLIVLDFDKTLSRIDQNQFFILCNLHKIGIIRIILARLTGKMSKFEFSLNLNTIQTKNFENNCYFLLYIYFLKLFINYRLLNSVKYLQSKGFKIFLSSNSNHKIIKKMSYLFGLDFYLGSGSDLSNYGPSKIPNTFKLFPLDDFSYEYLISDNLEDIQYANFFKMTVKWSSKVERNLFYGQINSQKRIA
jgi:hypothetical protein